MCCLYNFAVNVVRVSIVIGFSIVFTTSFANSTQNERKTSSTVLHPPIKNGWESKQIITPPIRKGWEAIENSSPLQKIKAKLTKSDYIAALQAMHHALSEVDDGQTYVWRSTKSLRGKIQPTNVFRDADSRLCRHVIYTLYIDQYSRTIEGIACRSLTGRWNLSG